MSQNSPGRPPKPEGKKRQQLHISVYNEDLERLEQLTDNRSEFLRDCIKDAWEKEHGGNVTVTLTLPLWLLRDLVEVLVQQLPTRHAGLAETLLTGLLAQAQAEVRDAR